LRHEINRSAEQRNNQRDLKNCFFVHGKFWRKILDDAEPKKLQMNWSGRWESNPRLVSPF
jgi:hypothetical protein